MMTAWPNKPVAPGWTPPQYAVAVAAWEDAERRARDWWAAQPARQLRELEEALERLEKQ